MYDVRYVRRVHEWVVGVPALCSPFVFTYRHRQRIEQMFSKVNNNIKALDKYKFDICSDAYAYNGMWEYERGYTGYTKDFKRNTGKKTFLSQIITNN